MLDPARDVHVADAGVPIDRQSWPLPVIVCVAAVLAATVLTSESLPMPWYIAGVVGPTLVATMWAFAPRQGSQPFMIDLSIFALWLLAVVSLTWGEVPWTDAMTPLTMVVGASLSCFLVASVVDVRRMVIGLAYATAALAAVFLAHAVIAPGAAFGSSPPGLKSFFWHKTEVGLAMASAMALSVAIESPSHRRTARGLILIALVLSQSVTAMLGAAMALFAQFVMRGLTTGRQSRRRGIVFLTAGSLSMIVIVLVAARNQIFALFGKDATVTGRDGIWRATLDLSIDRPWLGHGVGSFWSASSPEAAAVRRAVDFEAGGPHQGLIDVFTELGTVGTVLVLMLLMTTLARFGRRSYVGRTSLATLALLGVTVVTVVTSLTEATLLVPGIAWLSLVNAYLLQPSSTGSTADDW